MVNQSIRVKGRWICQIGGLLGMVVWCWSLMDPVQAQVVSDGSLSTTVQSSDGLNFTVGGGDRSGANLFHSFSQFSVPTQGVVWFTSSSGVDRILSRVTGRDVSSIDGTLRVQGSADLFLLNPNGIRFGANARLDLNGSFLATTADSLIFDSASGEVFQFRARNPEGLPLLTLSQPIGLGFEVGSSGVNSGGVNSGGVNSSGVNSGDIVFQGSGHQLTRASDFALVVNLATEPLGLEVLPGKNLALIGGNLLGEGAVVMAPGGQVELAAVGAGTVALDTNNPQWRFDYGNKLDNSLENGRRGNIGALGTIALNQRSFVDVSGTPAGAVHFQGQDIALAQGSMVMAISAGPLDAGTLSVDASRSLKIQEPTPDGVIRSQFSTTTLGAGAGGTIQIRSPLIQLLEGGTLSNATFGLGRGGEVQIQGSERLEIMGFYAQAAVNSTLISAISSLTYGLGPAGNVGIDSDRVHLTDGGSIVTATNSLGQGADIVIHADTMELTGISSRLSTGGISSASLGPGQAGNLTLNTRSLAIANGAQVGSFALGSGNAGNVLIRATEQINLQGVAPGINTTTPLPSLIVSGAILLDAPTRALFSLPDIPTSNSGSVEIQTPRLRVAEGAQVTVRTDGPGNPGSLKITAQQILLEKQGGITATTIVGSGGNIEINTDTLRLNNSLINASVFGNGQGGNVMIRARDTIEVLGIGSQQFREQIVFPAFLGTLSVRNFSQGIFASAPRDGTAGQIAIEAGHLRLLDGTVLGAITLGKGEGGDIRIQTQGDLQVRGSLLVTSTFGSGGAGDVHINTERLLVQEGGQVLTTTFGSGNAGNLTIAATQSIKVQGSSVLDGLFSSGLFADARANAIGNSGDITLTTPELLVENGAQVSVSSLSTGTALGINPNSNTTNPLMSQAGNISAEVGSLWLDRGYIVAQSLQGQGGNIDLTVGNLVGLRHNSFISAQAGTESNGGGDGGNITINAPFILATDNSDIVANAFQGQGGNIHINTQGLFGLAFRPQRTPESDISASSQFGVNGIVAINHPEVDLAPGLVELSPSPASPETEITTGCGAIGASRFVATGRGGMVVSPAQRLVSDRAWDDLRGLDTPSGTPSGTPPGLIPPQELKVPPSSPPFEPLIEATGWQKTEGGQVVLLTEPALALPVVATHVPTCSGSPQVWINSQLP